MKNDALTKLLTENNLDAFLITSVANIIYLTGYNGFSPIEREAYLLVTKNSMHLITDGRYINAVKNLSDKISLHEITTNTLLPVLLDKIVLNEKIKSLGFESDNLTVAEYTKIRKTNAKLKGISINNLRVIKTNDEIKKIKKSCDIANIAFAKTKKDLKVGMSEIEVAWIFEKYVKEQKAELSFPTIVAFGKNSATPHHSTSDQKLKANDIILIDYGVKYENYCSDMTKTFFIGKLDKELEKIYNTVKSSQLVAIEFLKSSLKTQKVIKASTIDKIAREYILSKNYPTIPHSLGHGIGLEVHETPRLGPTSKDALKEGMVFSIEPGIYLHKLGGVRIEDLFAIQNKKLIRLT